MTRSGVDPQSVDALGIVARRLRADGIGLLFSLREGSRQAALLESLRELALKGLERADAEKLPAVKALNPRVGRRLVDETGDNPLALIELAAELGPAERAHATPLPPRLALTPRIEARFLRQVRATSRCRRCRRASPG